MTNFESRRSSEEILERIAMLIKRCDEWIEKYAREEKAWQEHNNNYVKMMEARQALYRWQCQREALMTVWSWAVEDDWNE